jgi:beta-glucanase (GH16 family)
LPADGLLEVRAQLPAPVHRVWPAAWIIDKRNDRDTGLCWPLSIEYDVYESTGGLGAADVCASVHWGLECNVDRGNQFGCTGRPNDGGFHTYGLRFSPQRVIWYIDGREYYRNDVGFNGEPLSTVPFALILNTAISSNFGGPPLGTPPQTVTHSFDWVRVWTAV